MEIKIKSLKFDADKKLVALIETKVERRARSTSGEAAAANVYKLILSTLHFPSTNPW
ncbi:MAG: hypothetical protein MJY44_04370 [Bacteroidales bacterium]|nr:hypothetical protein [Bacteroidales bacterium]